MSVDWSQAISLPGLPVFTRIPKRALLSINVVVAVRLPLFYDRDYRADETKRRQRICSEAESGDVRNKTAVFESFRVHATAV